MVASVSAPIIVAGEKAGFILADVRLLAERARDPGSEPGEETNVRGGLATA